MVLLCPHCNEELIIADNKERNAETYLQPIMAKAECCGKGVYVIPRVVFSAQKYTGDKKEDEWGDPILK